MSAASLVSHAVADLAAALPAWLTWLGAAAAAVGIGWGAWCRGGAVARMRGGALIDPLTHLPNQTLLADRLSHAGSRAARQRDGGDDAGLAVLFLDIDGFKPLNDSFGRASGDALLQGVAGRMQQVARASDTLARVGADQFVLLLEGRQVTGTAVGMAERIQDAMAAPMDVAGHDITLSLSVGIAIYPDHGAPGTLLAAAEAAKDAAKQNGGGGYALFESGMVGDSARQVALQQALRQATARRELSLHYQPKVRAGEDRVAGMEALLRWRHPELGMVSPAQFIPVAERFGLIGALGNWVIDEACAQLGRWQREGRSCRVAINLSPHQLRQGDLVRRIGERLAQHGVHARHLICEITESAMLDGALTTERQLRGLSELGVHLSIDDFGTGYSSLARLRRLPATQLKIDRSLVVDGTLHADGRAVLDAIIRLAHALRMEVVAEGVETQAQRHCMAELDCDLIQGYLIARPMPAGQISDWLDAFSAEHGATAD